MSKESEFQSNLIKDIRAMYPKSIILKNDPNYRQGIPDLLILHKDKWAALEVKKYKGASEQPNQSYYVDTMNEMSFASFVYPENKEEVLYGIQKSFGS